MTSVRKARRYALTSLVAAAICCTAADVAHHHDERVGVAAIIGTDYFLVGPFIAVRWHWARKAEGKAVNCPPD